MRQPYVNKRLALLALDPTAVRVIQTAGLGSAHLYALCRVHDAPTQRRLARQAAADDWSMRELERAIQRQRHGLPGAPRHWTGAHPDAVALAGQLEDAHRTRKRCGDQRLRAPRQSLRVPLRRRLGTRSTGGRETLRRRAGRRREPVARARESMLTTKGGEVVSLQRGAERPLPASGNRPPFIARSASATWDHLVHEVEGPGSDHLDRQG